MMLLLVDASVAFDEEIMLLLFKRYPLDIRVALVAFRRMVCS